MKNNLLTIRLSVIMSLSSFETFQPLLPNCVVEQADCAICSDGYSASLGFTCNRCSNNIGSIVVTIVLALALLASVILAVSYLLSRKLENENNRSCVEHLMRHIPVQSAKIVIVAWQIVIQVRCVCVCVFSLNCT